MLYIDSANIGEVKKAARINIVKGVTTNPTLLLKEKKQRKDIINDILTVNLSEVFVQTEGTSTEEIWNDAIDILNTFHSSSIILKIPAHLNGIEVIKKLKEKHPKVKTLATAIYSVDQGILAAIAGSDYIAPYINRMENNNIDPYEVIRQTKKIYDNQRIETKVLGASFKNTSQIIKTLTAGAHSITIPYELLENMANKGLVLEGIKQFNNDALELKKLTGVHNV